MNDRRALPIAIRPASHTCIKIIDRYSGCCLVWDVKLRGLKSWVRDVFDIILAVLLATVV